MKRDYRMMPFLAAALLIGGSTALVMYNNSKSAGTGKRQNMPIARGGLKVREHPDGRIEIRRMLASAIIYAYDTDRDGYIDADTKHVVNELLGNSSMPCTLQEREELQRDYAKIYPRLREAK